MLLNVLLSVVLVAAVCIAGGGGVRAARILTVFPAVSRSHFAVGEALSVGLAKAGHQVTLIGPYDYQSELPNLQVVQLDGIIEVANERTKNINSVDQFDLPFGSIFAVLFWDAQSLSNFTLMHPKVRHLMDTQTYDLVIVEIFVSEALIGLGQHFGAPVIAVSTFGANKWTADLVGTPSPMSYVAHAFSTFSDRMTLAERVVNTLLTALETVLINVLNYPYQRIAYNAAFPDARLTYDEAVANVSLVLLNSHFSINGPRPYVPNMIEVGGLHVRRDIKPLPQRLQRFLDDAPDGVVYFSLGSFVRSAYMSEQHRQTFVRVFGSLRQRVVWKFESDDLSDRPDNVLIDKWLPQNDILAHPNVRLFITHGGLLSTTEAVYHGVPVVGMPLFGDQMRNVQGAVKAGWGVQLNYANVTEASLRWALGLALNDGSFAQTAKQVSQHYRDQPMTPLETAVYWTEYVLRYRGAPHLRSASMDLNFWQYHCLDVFAILGTGVLLWTAAVGWLVRWWWLRRRSAKAAKIAAVKVSTNKTKRK